MSVEEDDNEASDDASDDDMERWELGSGAEEDGTDEEGASTTTSARQINVMSESREEEQGAFRGTSIAYARG